MNYDSYPNISLGFLWRSAIIKWKYLLKKHVFKTKNSMVVLSEKHKNKVIIFSLENKKFCSPTVSC